MPGIIGCLLQITLQVLHTFKIIVLVFFPVVEQYVVMHEEIAGPQRSKNIVLFYSLRILFGMSKIEGKQLVSIETQAVSFCIKQAITTSMMAGVTKDTPFFSR